MRAPSLARPLPSLQLVFFFFVGTEPVGCLKPRIFPLYECLGQTTLVAVKLKRKKRERETVLVLEETKTLGINLSVIQYVFVSYAQQL